LSYRIFETKNFTENLDEIVKGGSRKVEEKLKETVYPRLKDEPHFGPQIKKLKNWEPPTWRFRIGDWRFFYEIDEKARVIFMIAAHHRKEAYRR
jgi:mRNA interferase RelE/StbE